MAGYNLFVISGIDGEFVEFNSSVQPFLLTNDFIKLSYNRTLSFIDNLDLFKERINLSSLPCVLVGWSIGAVAAAFLAKIETVEGVIMINPFFSRADVLNKRGIECEEEVCLGVTSSVPTVEYLLLAGKDDAKIDYHNSIQIQQHYHITQSNLLLFEKVGHSIATFPKRSIADIINKLCYERYDHSC